MISSPTLGKVSPRIQLVDTYTLPATLVQTLTSVQDASVPPPLPLLPTVYITTGNVSSSPDNPGMVSVPAPVYYSAAQDEAIRSAAQNTALAYGISVRIAGDQAALQGNQALLALLKQQVVNTTDEYLFPP